MTDDYERHYRKEWMSDDQWECAQMLADLFFGWHHVLGEIKKLGSGIKLNTPATNWSATYDYDGLTRAVVMAHDRMIRFEFRPSGPRMMQLALFKRHQRSGKMHERHPTIEEAIVEARKRHPIGGQAMTDAPDMPEVIWASGRHLNNASWGDWDIDKALPTDTPYVLQSIYDTEIAEKDARIARLEGAIFLIREASQEFSKRGQHPGAMRLALLGNIDVTEGLLAAEGGEG